MGGPGPEGLRRTAPEYAAKTISGVCRDMKKAAAFLLSVVLAFSTGVTGAMAAEAGMSHFQKVNAYSDGQFSDVAPGDWYAADVRTAYELGLMGGESDGYFNAAGQITVAQAIIMAARLHSIYHTGSRGFMAGDPWYAPYISYAKEHGIVTGEPDIFAPATRAQLADLLSRALPAAELESINQVDVNAIPDVKAGNPYADSIYMLYRAGVLTGSGSRRAFYPGSSVSRAEAAVIIARMADKSLRKSFALPLQYTGPGLTAQEAQGDSFFANSAILGNSLVEGLRMFSNLKSLHYFSATSVSVVSATQTKNVRLADGSTGTLVQSLCQGQYDRIYIELGINEIGGNVDTFIQRYGNMIDTIRAAESNADIYILSVLPVTRAKSQAGSFNMTRVNLYNAALSQLAAEKQCYYMDVCSAFLGSDGYLPSGWSSDGVHLYAKYYSVWENCMRTLY